VLDHSDTFYHCSGIKTLGRSRRLQILMWKNNGPCNEFRWTGSHCLVIKRLSSHEIH